MIAKFRSILLAAFFFFGLLTTSQAKAQIPMDTASGKYAYQGIIKVDSLSKKELYETAKQWVLKTLKSSDNVIELEDKDFNSITASGAVNLNNVTGGMIRYLNNKLGFKLIIEFKEGRYKYSFENLTFNSGTASYNLETLDFIKKISSDVDTKMRPLVTSLNSHIVSSNKSKSNW